MTFNTEIFDRIFAKGKNVQLFRIFSQNYGTFDIKLFPGTCTTSDTKNDVKQRNKTQCIVLACVLGPSIIIIQTFCTLKIKLFFFLSKIHSE